MNILFYHKFIISPTSGGISKITYTLYKLFTAKGHNVYFLSENIPCKCKCKEGQLLLPNRVLTSVENIEYFHYVLELYSINVVINQYALDAQTTFFFVLCKKRGDFKLVSCFHNAILTPAYNFALQKEYVIKKYHLFFIYYVLRTSLSKCLLTSIYISKHRSHYKQAVHISDAVVNLCDGLQTELLKMIGEDVSSKYYVIPNCVNVHNHNSDKKENIVLWVGTFDNEIKRPDVMLDIWSKVERNHQDWDLIFLGDGPAYDEIKSYARKLNVKNVHFEGRVPPDEYYKKAKVLCLTSTHESFSLVTVEAKTFGVVPVIMNTFPAASIVVNNRVNGLLINSYNKTEFVNVLDKLLSDDIQLAAYSYNAILSINEFSPKFVYEKWQRLLSDLSCQV